MSCYQCAGSPNSPTRASSANRRPDTIRSWGTSLTRRCWTLLGGFSYVTNAPEAIENFRHVRYPQQLRVLLGIAKLAGAIVLLLPWLPTLKEWAYAGFTFTWIAATVAHYLAADGKSLLPVGLLGLLAVSYVTRPANRRGFAKSMLAQGDGSTPLPASGPYGGIGRGVEDLGVR
jgi:DoxX-like family